MQDTLSCFQQLAARKRDYSTCPVIGITGSNGKTIVKEWIAQLIGTTKNLARSPKSYNSQIGVPLSVWQLTKETEIAVFEAGISQKGEMQKLAQVIKPTIGLVTNIGAAHQENFSSRKEKLFEKLQLFKNSEVIIYSRDVPFVKEGIREIYPEKKTYTWGSDKSADVRVLKKEISGSVYKVSLQKEGSDIELEFPFTDEVSFENGMHAVSTMFYLGYTVGYISEAVKKLVPVAMRMELKEGINNCILVNDSYNSDISSLALSLDFFDSAK